MNRAFTLFLTLLVLAAWKTAAEETTTPSPATNAVELTSAYITQLAEELRTNHPAFRATQARTDAAQANADSVRTWDDPMLRVGKMAAERQMRMDDGDLLYGVEQKIPLFGKSQAERRMAKAETAVEESMSAAKFQELRRDLAQAVFKTALADRVVEISQQDLVWLETMLHAAQRRYEVGDTSQFDVLRLQNEYSQRLNQLNTERELLKNERAKLNRLLNRDLQSPWPVLHLPAIAAPVAYNQRLADLALKYQPELNSRRLEIGQAEAAVTVARRERYPEVSVGAEARNYSGDGEFRQAMFTLTFSLPWVNQKSYSAAIKRERSKLQAAQFNAADYELELRNEVFDLTVKIDAARREAVLYRDEIIPRSETAFRSVQSSWETASGMFRDVLDARRMWLEAQLMYARAVAEQFQMLSDLVLCCGLGDLESLQMIGVEIKSESESKTEK